MGILVLIGTGAAVLLLGCSAVLLYRMLNPVRKTYGHALALGMLTSPEELGMAYREQQFQFSDGTTTQGWVIQGRCKEGPILVMTHGWDSSIYNSLLRVPLFTSWVSELVLYDMRAHGESTAKACHLGTSEADDVHAVIDQIGRKYSPVVLFGSSMGAGVSLAAASTNGRRGDHCQSQEQIVGVICEAPYRHAIEPVSGHFRQKDWPPFPVVHMTYLCLLLGLRGLWQFDRAAYAAKLSCPLLVLHGTDDPISSYESGKAIAAAADRGRLVTFDGGVHGNLAENDIELYKGAIDSFFTDLQADQAFASDSQQPIQTI